MSGRFWRGLAVGLAISLAFWAAVVLVGRAIDQNLRSRPHGPVVTCQEDDPCWRCADMGNRRCGP